MTLDKAEYYQYINAHLRLLYFVGVKEQIIPATATFADFRAYGLHQKFRCRQALYNKMELLDAYIEDKKQTLSDADLEVISAFPKRISSTFIILKCLSKHAVFIDTNDNTFYAVKALSDPFQLMFDYFPAMCKTTLVPFRDKIIYDGFIEPYLISFGFNLKGSFQQLYKKAKNNKAIISKLP